MAKRKSSNQPAAASNVQPQQIQVSASASFSGPLPPPNVLAQYNDVLENGAERIFAMVENQSRHRMQLEKQVISADVSRGRWGLLAGVALMLLAFAFAAYLTYADEIIAAVVVVCVTVGSIGGAFIYGTISQRQERKERAEILAGRR